MANTDFRVSIGFFKNPKARRLKRRHGDSGLIALLKIWEFAAEHRSKGILYDVSSEDLLDIAETDDPQFVDDLINLKLLDIRGDWYAVHGWEEHNGYAYYAIERQQRAKHAARKRWTEEDADGNADGMQAACEQHASGNAPSPAPAPTPAPAPDPGPSRKDPTQEVSGDTYTRACAREDWADDDMNIF